MSIQPRTVSVRGAQLLIDGGVVAEDELIGYAEGSRIPLYRRHQRVAVDFRPWTGELPPATYRPVLAASREFGEPVEDSELHTRAIRAAKQRTKDTRQRAHKAQEAA